MADTPYVFIPTDISDDFSRLIMDIRGDVPGTIPSNIQSAMFGAFDEFFDFTNVWQIDQDITLAANVTSYTLPDLDQGRYQRLLVLYDSQDSEQQWVDRAKFILPSGIKITTAPTTSGAIWVAKMSLRCVGSTANGYPDIPDWIIQRYRDALYNGTRRFLHMSSGKPYSDKDMAAQYGKMFTSSKAMARINAIKANVLGQTNWAYPRGPYTRGSQRW